MIIYTFIEQTSVDDRVGLAWARVHITSFLLTIPGSVRVLFWEFLRSSFEFV